MQVSNNETVMDVGASTDEFAGFLKGKPEVLAALEKHL